ncbi:MAG: HAD family hydrolase [Candidatus Binatia bacterium]|nr:HAD family hydrolase [Candidatus Binatia bacterium]
MTVVRAVLFDLFDTLVDLHFSRLPMAAIGGRTMPSTILSQHEAIALRGHDVPFDDFLATLRETDRELMESHIDRGIELPTLLRFSRVVERLELDDAGLPEALTRAHMGKIQDVAETPAHHDEVLAELARSRRLGLCSNFSHTETALDILETAELKRHFSALTVSETVGIRKPRPEIFRHALEALGTTPEETVHVGDNLDADVRGASSLGMRTVWVERRVRDKERALREYDGPEPTWVIRDLSELVSLL